MENNKKIYSPTATEKENTIKHINYEIDMFKICYEDLKRAIGNPTTIADDIFVNILIETFLLHFRNLYTFFYTKKNNRKDDDALAEDYLISIDYFYSERSLKEKFKDYLVKLNKMLSHLSYSREKYIFKQDNYWIFTELFQLIEKTEKIFFDLISKEQKYKF